MKTSSMIVGLTAAAFVGAAVFLATRPAAAKAAAEDAFTVSADCSTITISDMEKANSAAKSIGLIVKPTPDSDALETLKASLEHYMRRATQPPKLEAGPGPAPQP